MAKAASIFKNKKLMPWIIGGVVLVGGGVLYLSLKGQGGGGGGTVSASGPSEQLQIAQAQIGAGVAAAQLSANVETSRIAAEADSYRYGADTSLALAGIAAETEMYNTAQSSQVSLAGIAAQQNIALAQEMTAQRGTEIQGMVATAGIEAQRDISAQQFGFLTSQEQFRAQTEQARISADVSMNQANQKTARKGQTLGFLGSVVGGALALFSDVRMKSGITWTGESSIRNPHGRGSTEFGMYEWDWRGTMYEGSGVLAQEILGVLPGAVIDVRRRNRLAVDYAMLT